MHVTIVTFGFAHFKVGMIGLGWRDFAEHDICRWNQVLTILKHSWNLKKLMGRGAYNLKSLMIR